MKQECDPWSLSAYFRRHSILTLRNLAVCLSSLSKAWTQNKQHHGVLLSATARGSLSSAPVMCVCVSGCHRRPCLPGVFRRHGQCFKRHGRASLNLGMHTHTPFRFVIFLCFFFFFFILLVLYSHLQPHYHHSYFFLPRLFLFFSLFSFLLGFLIFCSPPPPYLFFLTYYQPWIMFCALSP